VGLKCNTCYFYCGADMQAMYCDNHLSVCPSVRASVKCVDWEKTKAHSGKTSIMTNTKSPTSFPMSVRWTAYVALNTKEGLKGDNFCRFSYIKLGFCRRKCATKFLCENCDRQSCKAFIALCVRAEIVAGGCRLVCEILHQSDPSPSKTALSSLYSSVAAQV